MKSSRWLWRTVFSITLVTTCLFLCGFIYAVNDVLNPKPTQALNETNQEPVRNVLSADKIQIVALGDSLTKGTGDNSGQGGYVGDVRSGLAQLTKKPVYVLQNFAINGYHSDQLLHDLQNKRDERQTLAQANVILLSIGGNDLFHLGQDEFDPALIQKRADAAMKNMSGIFNMLSKTNPKADIMYIGLYNPFLALDKQGKGSLVVQAWNDKLFQIANQYPNITVVPTYDLFLKDEKRFLYSDHFHPDTKGYERIADRIIQDLQ